MCMWDKLWYVHPYGSGKSKLVARWWYKYHSLIPLLPSFLTSPLSPSLLLFGTAISNSGSIFSPIQCHQVTTKSRSPKGKNFQIFIFFQTKRYQLFIQSGMGNSDLNPNYHSLLFLAKSHKMCNGYKLISIINYV